jgi:hypothetical protein
MTKQKCKQAKFYQFFNGSAWENVTDISQLQKGKSFQMFDKNEKIIHDTSIFRTTFMAETDAYLDIFGNIKVEYCTDWDNIIVDDDINAHRVCKKCGNIQRLTSRPMDAMDDLTLDQLDLMIINQPNKGENMNQDTEITQEENPKCDKCNGELFVVQPIIKLDGRTLMECMSCHERIYLFVEIIESLGTDMTITAGTLTSEQINNSQ